MPVETRQQIDQLVGEPVRGACRRGGRSGTPRGCRGRRRGGSPGRTTRCWGRGRHVSRGSTGRVARDRWGWGGPRASGTCPSGRRRAAQRSSCRNSWARNRPASSRASSRSACETCRARSGWRSVNETSTRRSEVEPCAGRQRVHDRTAEEQGRACAGLVGVGDGVLRVDDEDGPAAGDLEPPLLGDDRGRVLVDPDAQQGRRARRRPPSGGRTGPLWSKCWSITMPSSRPIPTVSCASRWRGVIPSPPREIMWLLITDAPAEVPATAAPRRCAAWMAWPSAVPVTHWESLSWLPPVMKMPVAPAVVAARSGSSASRRLAGRRVRHLRRTEPGEGVGVDLGHLGLHRRRRRDHDDAGPAPAAAEGDEASQQPPLADLVLGAADDHQRARRGRSTGARRAPGPEWSRVHRNGVGVEGLAGSPHVGHVT